MATLVRNRTDEAKKEQEQRRALLTLCARYIQSAGYPEASAKLIHDSGINLDKFDVADNIDLSIILKEYEEYYNLKFGKLPKIIKKCDFAEEKKITRPPVQRAKTNSAGTKKSGRENSTERKSDDLELSGKAITVSLT